MVSSLIPQGAALRITEEISGGLIEENETLVVTGTVQVEAVPNDPDAVSLLMINTGSNPVMISLGTRPSSVNGISLLPFGGLISLTIKDDFLLPSRAWFCISPAGASYLYVLRLRVYKNT